MKEYIMLRRYPTFLVILFSMVFSIHSQAGRVLSNPTVVSQVLSDSFNYGGCFIRIGYNIGAEHGLDCSDVVTFDCLNTPGNIDKASANRNYSQAQLAYVAGKQVRMTVDDSVILNGQCLSDRIDILGDAP